MRGIIFDLKDSVKDEKLKNIFEDKSYINIFGATENPDRYVDSGEKVSSTGEYDALIYYKNTTSAEYIDAPNEMEVIEINKGKVKIYNYLYLIALPVVSILGIYFYDKKQKNNNKEDKSNKVGFLLISACIVSIFYSATEIARYIINSQYSNFEIIVGAFIHTTLIVSSVLIIKRKKVGVYIYLLVNRKKDLFKSK